MKAIEKFADVLSILESFEATEGSENKPKKRVEIRKEAASENFSLSEEVRQQVEELPEVLGTFNASAHQDLTSSAAAYELVSEVKHIKSVQDVIDGRYTYLRGIASDIITEINTNESDPENTPGALDVPELGLTFRKEIRGGAVLINWDKFSESFPEVYKKLVIQRVTTIVDIVDGEQVNSQTTTENIVDEKRVVQLMSENVITLEMLNSCLGHSKRVVAMVLRNLK